MAWISVHTCVDGPKLRDLRKRLKCSKFEATGILVYLWFWGLENAEKDGHILNADREDIEECFGGSGCKIPTNHIVEALIDTRWIDETKDGLYIHDWEEWQEQWYKAKARRENDNERKRESRRKKAAMSQASDNSCGTSFGDSADVPADVPVHSIDVTASEAPAAVEGKKESKYTPDFDVFWGVYPRNADKGQAFKKYQARLKEGFSPEELLTAARNYAQRCKRECTEQRYIKHAATFLSDTRPFLDFLPRQESPPEDVNVAVGNPFQNWRDE